MWCAMENPIESTASFCNACYDVGVAVTDYLKNLDQEQIEMICDDLDIRLRQFDALSEAEKGDAIGFFVARYGVEFFAGGATFKSVSAVKKLRAANRACNLESMSLSEANKKAMTTAALKHAAERDNFFKNVKISVDKQNKHVVGSHNFEPLKSIFEHKDPQGLLNRFAGTGIAVNNEVPGMAGYKELVDFKEHIGYWVERGGKNPLPTSRGIIHYSKEGAHIVPAHP